MMGLDQIAQMSDEAAQEAARKKKLPYSIFDQKEIDETRFHFPNLGSYVPKGWIMVDHWLCDKTGWGTEHERALTLSELKAKLTEHMNQGNPYSYATIEEGQFQIVLGVFQKRTKKKKKSA